ncbi:MAG: caspase family protein [Nitrososphaeraceae archaeon]
MSTYDVNKNDPYVGGLKLDDLRKQIYSSESKRNAIIVLDCCYSGVATEDTRGGETIKDLTPVLDRNIGNIKDRNYGSGKFIISSSANDQVSWGMTDCTHFGDYKEPHPHSEFTYYLLEGIRGAAADETTGEITLIFLCQYINQKLSEKNKQNSYMTFSEGSNLNAITIALSVDKFDYYITSLEKTIKERFPEGDSSFPPISYISDCAKKLNELKSKNPDNPNILLLVIF